MAGAEGTPCELKIQGHSIVQLTLVEKTRLSGVRFDKPGETVQLPAGEYRVEAVELEGGFSLLNEPGQRREWFQVTPEGPNELVIGAPLYPTATAVRHGGFLQLDFAGVVDSEGRSYIKTADRVRGMPPPPTFAVYKDEEEIGSGTFEYG
jgi:hypothetical protein